MVNFFILLGNASPHLLNDFPDPKGLLNNALSRSLGVGDLSQYIQYSCTEHAGVKVRTKDLPSLRHAHLGLNLNARDEEAYPSRIFILYDLFVCRKLLSKYFGPPGLKQKVMLPRR